MSRVAGKPIELPAGVSFVCKDGKVTVKGSNGSLNMTLASVVSVSQQDNMLQVQVTDNLNPKAVALAGTTRALVNNMVIGVSTGFTKSLDLVGVGYRAQMKGADLDLNLGYSHPVIYQLPAGITVDLPSKTNIIVKGIDKQKVGQVAAEIRAIRPPEPYKGKGVKYTDETIIRKETKKK